jgi:hypothetical protein
MITIGVIGKNEQHDNDIVSDGAMQAAFEVGKVVAELGGVVVTGGRRGVMEASSRGAKEGGGLTIAFLPSLDRRDANPYVDIVFPTGLGRARNLLTARSCNALVMIGGSCGTLNELTIAYAEARPVVVMEGTGGWSDKIRSVLHKGRYIDERENIEVHFETDARRAAEKAFALAREFENVETKDAP